MSLKIERKDRRKFEFRIYDSLIRLESESRLDKSNFERNGKFWKWAKNDFFAV